MWLRRLFLALAGAGEVVGRECLPGGDRERRSLFRYRCCGVASLWLELCGSVAGRLVWVSPARVRVLGSGRERV
jgi:hypothetical protein